MIRQITIDLTRCKCCNKRPRGKMNLAEFQKRHPFCSYHCEQTYSMREALRYCRTLSENRGES